MQGRPAYDLIIFDMDGTLVDTRDGIAETIRLALGSAGFGVPPPTAIYPMIGLPLDTIFRTLGPADLTAEAVDSLVREYRVVYRREAMALVRPFPGVTDTLTALSRAGIALSVATGRVKAMADEVLARSGLTAYMSLVLGMDQVAHPKPAPDLARFALEHFGTTPTRALVVGDTVHDIEMGTGAGTDTCAVTYGAQSRLDLLASSPGYLIDSILELMPIVLPAE